MKKISTFENYQSFHILWLRLQQSHITACIISRNVFFFLLLFPKTPTEWHENFNVIEIKRRFFLFRARSIQCSIEINIFRLFEWIQFSICIRFDALVSRIKRVARLCCTHLFFVCFRFSITICMRTNIENMHIAQCTLSLAQFVVNREPF